MHMQLGLSHYNLHLEIKERKINPSTLGILNLQQWQMEIYKSVI